MSALIVQHCGAGTSLQDGGRLGWQRFGISPSGAMDRVSLALANALAGNARHACALEFTLIGGAFVVDGGPVRVALAGADCSLRISGRAIPLLTSVTAWAGEIIEVGTARSGLFAYLAIGGGFDTEPDLGSRSLQSRAGLGGIDGRALRAGDRVPVGAFMLSGSERMLNAPDPESGPIRVMLGPQDDYFTSGGLNALLGGTFAITPEADRMGFRLSGPRIEHGPKGYNIISDGIATGAIQVPGSGQPIILLADRQTTGGYPKIATVISADLARLSQLRPGSQLTFLTVSREQAVEAARRLEAKLVAAIAAMAHADGNLLSSERLLGLNMVSGVVRG